LEEDQKLIFHSDRGIQYACREFAGMLAKNGQICQSMSGKGCCYDNAVAESFFRTLKAELVHRSDFATRKQAEEAIFVYIEDFYNVRRRHSALGNLTMEEFKNRGAAGMPINLTPLGQF